MWKRTAGKADPPLDSSDLASKRHRARDEDTPRERDTSTTDGHARVSRRQSSTFHDEATSPDPEVRMSGPTTVTPMSESQNPLDQAASHTTSKTANRSKTKSSSKAVEKDADFQGDPGERKQRRRKSSGSRRETGRNERRKSEPDTATKTSDVTLQRSASPPGRFPVSPHAQDQFPGQLSSQVSAVYRPPIAASEGGPGLAADYYGDAGESVADQPGYRIHSPSLIIGAEPHLLPASSVEAPPPEPSQLGATGAAASFYSGDFSEEDAGSSRPPGSANQSNAGSRPQRLQQPSSAPIIPTLGSVAVGAAAGYLGGTSHHVVDSQQSITQPSAAQFASSSQASKPAKTSSQSSQSNSASFGLGGAEGVFVAAQAYNNHHHHHPHPNAASVQRPTRQHAGTLDTIVNFVKDPDAVAQFEEYTEFIGICRGCFEPGSSPRDAPRKHKHGRRRTDHRHDQRMRVDKQRRYSTSSASSGDEERSRKTSSWLGAGVAAYGLATIGKTLFNQKNDFDDTYEVKSGRYSPPRRNLSGHHITTQHDRINDGRKASLPFNESKTSSTRLPVSVSPQVAVPEHTSISNRSKQPNSVSARSQRKSSPIRPKMRDEHSTRLEGSDRDRKHEPEKTRRRKKERNKGLFSFLSPSSSSSSSTIATHHSSKAPKNPQQKPREKIKSNREAEAALLGLGVATAALAQTESRAGKKVRGHRVPTSLSIAAGSSQREGGRKSRHSASSSEDIWESASEGQFSDLTSDLAFGGSVRQSSSESLSSLSSGTKKWNWRWGKKNQGKKSSTRQPLVTDPTSQSMPPLKNSETMPPLGTTDVETSTANGTGPLQFVYPIPTTDPSRYDAEIAPAAVRQYPMKSSNSKMSKIQQPQPLPPTSSILRSSLDAETGLPVDKVTLYSTSPSVQGSQHAAHTSNSKKSTGQTFELGSDIGVLRLQRSETSPARITDVAQEGQRTSPQGTSGRRDSNSVRFAVSEEQEEDHRRERRRKRKEERAIKKAQGSKGKTSEDRDSYDTSTHRDQDDEGKADVTSVIRAEGVMNEAAIATIVGEPTESNDNFDETREQRRRRRRRERQYEDDQGKPSKTERRSTNAPDYDQVKETEDHVYVLDGHQPRGSTTSSQETSIWQEAGKSKRAVHEDYQTFFAPVDILNSSIDDPKISSRNPNADVEMDEHDVVEVAPRIITRRPDEPEFSPADSENRVFDSSKLTLPWQVPQLKLVQPTPPVSRAPSPFHDVREHSKDTDADQTACVEYDQANDKTQHEAQVNSSDLKDTQDDRNRYTKSDQISDQQVVGGEDRSTYDNGPTNDNDFEFAATLAAGAQNAGFDPSIILDDPTYHRRESPPGSYEVKTQDSPKDERASRRKKKDKKKRRSGPAAEEFAPTLPPSQNRSPVEDLNGTDFQDVEQDKKTSAKANEQGSKLDRDGQDSMLTRQKEREAAQSETGKGSSKAQSLWSRVLGQGKATEGEIGLASKPNVGHSREVADDEETVDIKRPKSQFPAIDGESQTIDFRAEDDVQSTGVMAQDPQSEEQVYIKEIVPSDLSILKHLDDLSDSVQEHDTDQSSPHPFLDRRPQPPRPPDDVDLQYLDQRAPLDERPQAPDPKSPDATSSALPTDSPTAIPVHFRRPGTNTHRRSSSQSPLASSPDRNSSRTQPKSRPRSTEFKDSKEIRPLWLVERHSTRQLPSASESYPPLPESHTTSAASSVYDALDDLGDSESPPETLRRSLQQEGTQGHDDNDGSTQPLGSGEPTPTAAFFKIRMTQESVRPVPIDDDVRSRSDSHPMSPLTGSLEATGPQALSEVQGAGSQSTTFNAGAMDSSGKSRQTSAALGSSKPGAWMIHEKSPQGEDPSEGHRGLKVVSTVMSQEEIVASMIDAAANSQVESNTPERDDTDGEIVSPFDEAQPSNDLAAAASPELPSQPQLKHPASSDRGLSMNTPLSPTDETTRRRAAHELISGIDQYSGRDQNTAEELTALASKESPNEIEGIQQGLDKDGDREAPRQSCVVKAKKGKKNRKGKRFHESQPEPGHGTQDAYASGELAQLPVQTPQQSSDLPLAPEAGSPSPIPVLEDEKPGHQSENEESQAVPNAHTSGATDIPEPAAHNFDDQQQPDDQSMMESGKFGSLNAELESTEDFQNISYTTKSSKKKAKKQKDKKLGLVLGGALAGRLPTARSQATKEQSSIKDLPAPSLSLDEDVQHEQAEGSVSNIKTNADSQDSQQPLVSEAVTNPSPDTMLPHSGQPSHFRIPTDDNMGEQISVIAADPAAVTPHPGTSSRAEADLNGRSMSPASRLDTSPKTQTETFNAPGPPSPTILAEKSVHDIRSHEYPLDSPANQLREQTTPSSSSDKQMHEGFSVDEKTSSEVSGLEEPRLGDGPRTAPSLSEVHATAGAYANAIANETLGQGDKVSANLEEVTSGSEWPVKLNKKGKKSIKKAKRVNFDVAENDSQDPIGLQEPDFLKADTVPGAFVGDKQIDSIDPSASFLHEKDIMEGVNTSHHVPHDTMPNIESSTLESSIDQEQDLEGDESRKSPVELKTTSQYATLTKKASLLDDTPPDAQRSKDKNKKKKKGRKQTWSLTDIAQPSPIQLEAEQAFEEEKTVEDATKADEAEMTNKPSLAELPITKLAEGAEVSGQMTPQKSKKKKKTKREKELDSLDLEKTVDVSLGTEGSTKSDICHDALASQSDKNIKGHESSEVRLAIGTEALEATSMETRDVEEEEKEEVKDSRSLSFGNNDASALDLLGGQQSIRDDKGNREADAEADASERAMSSREVGSSSQGEIRTAKSDGVGELSPALTADVDREQDGSHITTMEAVAQAKGTQLRNPTDPSSTSPSESSTITPAPDGIGGHKPLGLGDRVEEASSQDLAVNDEDTPASANKTTSIAPETPLVASDSLIDEARVSSEQSFGRAPSDTRSVDNEQSSDVASFVERYLRSPGAIVQGFSSQQPGTSLRPGVQVEDNKPSSPSQTPNSAPKHEYPVEQPLESGGADGEELPATYFDRQDGMPENGQKLQFTPDKVSSQSTRPQAVEESFSDTGDGIGLMDTAGDAHDGPNLETLSDTHPMAKDKNVLDKEISAIATPLSIGSIEPLDAEAQRLYNEEYKRELQNLLDAELLETHKDTNVEQSEQVAQSKASDGSTGSLQQWRPLTDDMAPGSIAAKSGSAFASSSAQTTAQDILEAAKHAQGHTQQSNDGSTEQHVSTLNLENTEAGVSESESKAPSEAVQSDNAPLRTSTPKSEVEGTQPNQIESTNPKTAGESGVDYFNLEPHGRPGDDVDHAELVQQSSPRQEALPPVDSEQDEILTLPLSKKAKGKKAKKKNASRESASKMSTLDSDALIPAITNDKAPQTSQLPSDEHEIQNQLSLVSEAVPKIGKGKKSKKAKQHKRTESPRRPHDNETQDYFQAREDNDTPWADDSMRNLQRGQSALPEDALNVDKGSETVPILPSAKVTEAKNASSRKQSKKEQKRNKTRTRAVSFPELDEAAQRVEDSHDMQSSDRQTALTTDSAVVSGEQDVHSTIVKDAASDGQDHMWQPLPSDSAPSAGNQIDNSHAQDLSRRSPADIDEKPHDLNQERLYQTQEGSHQYEDAEPDLIDEYAGVISRQNTSVEDEIIGSYGDMAGRPNIHAERQEDRDSPPRTAIEDVEVPFTTETMTAEPNDDPRDLRQKSTTLNDSDDSADSGFDVQRRRRRMANLAEEKSEPSPIDSTTKDRSSTLFDSSPSGRNGSVKTAAPEAHSRDTTIPIPDGAGEVESISESRLSSAKPSWSFDQLSDDNAEERPSIFGGPIRNDIEASPSGANDASGLRNTQMIAERSSVESLRSAQSRRDKRALPDFDSPSPVMKLRRASKQHRGDSPEESLGKAGQTPGLRGEQRKSRQSSASGAASVESIRAIIRTPDQMHSPGGQSLRSTGTPPLRRVDRSVSSDLRAASKKGGTSAKSDASDQVVAKPDRELDQQLPYASSSNYDPLKHKGKKKIDPDENMADYEGWGDVRGESPISPTRPPSLRKLQSMQFTEMEQRLNMLISENRLLQSAKSKAERRLEEQSDDHGQQRQHYEAALQEHKSYVEQRDSTLKEMKIVVEGLREQVAQLTEANEELSHSRSSVNEHDQPDWQQTSRELDDLRTEHTRLTSEHQGIVTAAVASIRASKDHELEQLRQELNDARGEIRRLQQRILASTSSDDIVEHDEDYFDQKCQELFKHFTSWVTRFSKLSDSRRCYMAGEMRNEAHRDVFEDAMLDGSEVDLYLQDRQKRRDVFTSVAMTLIFKHIFARYLFGMDREHRQKLKALDKTLQDVGPPSAVHKWRATTLKLLSQRPSFQSQRDADHQGVVDDVWDTLSTALPLPVTTQTEQCKESLGRIVNLAVDLSIDMRLQRAEYSMLPPPEPQFDPDTGDIINRLNFIAQSMNDCTSSSESNDSLEERGAHLRLVLFPLVVRITDDGDNVVIYPAQVQVVPPKKGKTVRVMSAAENRSEASFADGEDTVMEGGYF